MDATYRLVSSMVCIRGAHDGRMGDEPIFFWEDGSELLGEGRGFVSV